MTHKKDDFDPNDPNIIAHSRVEVLSSSTWGKSNIPVFATGIRINLALQEFAWNSTKQLTTTTTHP